MEYVAFSKKTLVIILIYICNHWGGWRFPWLLCRGTLYNHARLFFSVNFRSFRSKVRYKGRINNIPPLAIESKLWFWGSAINTYILHIILVHLTMLFVTELLQIVIGIDYTYGSRFMMYSLRLVCI